MIHAASLSLNGAMSPELISELKYIASVLVNCDTDHLPTHDWDVPVGLVSQGFRAQLARAALVVSLSAMRNMFRFPSIPSASS